MGKQTDTRERVFTEIVQRAIAAKAMEPETLEQQIERLEKLIRARNRVQHIKGAMQMTQDIYDRRMALHLDDLHQAEQEFDKVAEGRA